MSRSAITLSRIAITRRGMQTGGRHVPNPGQGGAPPQSTISPHTTDPSISSSSSTYLQPSNPSPTPLPLSPAPRYTAKSKIIPSRPARKVSVTLPNGDPEPLAYPPTQEYFDTLPQTKKDAHPLWQFFHLDSDVMKGLTAQDEGPRNQGSLEALEGDEDNVRSGTLFSSCFAVVLRAGLM
jgi:large subunit ribosomal protein L47